MSTKLESKSNFNGRLSDPDRPSGPTYATSPPSPQVTVRETDTATNKESQEVNEVVAKDSRRPSVVINAPLQGLPTSSNDLLPPLSFRKPSTPKLTHASKHPRAEENGTGRAVLGSERPLKRSRPKIRPRHKLDLDTFPVGFHKNLAQPPSPLFFSHSLRPRPLPPPSYSSAEAVAAMLNKVRDEAAGEGVTTLKLARGSLSTASPPHSTPSPGSWVSIERTSIPRSPDERGKQTGLQLLGNVGIVELLEQE